MTPTTGDWLRAFGEHGFAVVPGAVPRPLLGDAERALDRLVAREPPPDRSRHHFYWLHDPASADPLLCLARDHADLSRVASGGAGRALRQNGRMANRFCCVGRLCASSIPVPTLDLT